VTFEHPEEWRPLYETGSHVIAALRTIGRGTLIVIADGRFFATHAVEGTWGTWTGSLQWCHEVLGESGLVNASRVADVSAGFRHE
jgi:hypothetical protein